jgi:hypothetical protein
MSQVKITINRDGTKKFEIEGVSGKACLHKYESLREALGTQISRELKPEFHHEARQENKVAA